MSSVGAGADQPSLGARAPQRSPEMGADGRAPAKGSEVLERLALMPGGPQLLERAQGRDDIELVGGAVRDILRGVVPPELDVVLGGDPATFNTVALELASDLAVELGGEVTAHGRFGTAVLSWSEGRIDVAVRRAETYPQRGALPQVRPGGPEQDLRRRDFTVNAIAISLGGERRGQLRAVEHALEDLAEGHLRVLHEGSFLDDPTRLLRLCRYAARLDFEVEQETQLLAQQALANGALATISSARIGAELKLLLAERDPLAALTALEREGILEQLASRGPVGGLRPDAGQRPKAGERPDAGLRPRACLRLDAAALTAAAELLPDDGRLDLLALASLLTASAGEDDFEPCIAMLLGAWEYTASERKVVIEAARAASLAEKIAAASSSSELWRLLQGIPVEAVALAGGLGAAHRHSPKINAAIRAWLEELRNVRLQITGGDLLAAGLAPGPEIGLRLERAMCRRLDGELAAGRDAELEAALAEAPR